MFFFFIFLKCITCQACQDILLSDLPGTLSINLSDLPGQLCIYFTDLPIQFSYHLYHLPGPLPVTRTNLRIYQDLNRFTCLTCQEGVLIHSLVWPTRTIIQSLDSLSWTLIRQFSCPSRTIIHFKKTYQDHSLTCLKCQDDYSFTCMTYQDHYPFTYMTYQDYYPFTCLT